MQISTIARFGVVIALAALPLRAQRPSVTPEPFRGVAEYITILEIDEFETCNTLRVHYYASPSPDANMSSGSTVPPFVIHLASLTCFADCDIAKESLELAKPFTWTLQGGRSEARLIRLPIVGDPEQYSSLAEALVASGLAQASTSATRDLRDLQNRAEAAKLGCWSKNASQQP